MPTPPRTYKESEVTRSEFERYLSYFEKRVYAGLGLPAPYKERVMKVSKMTLLVQE